MATQKNDAALVNQDGRMTVTHLELCSWLEQRVYAFVRFMANPPQGSATRKLGSKKLIGGNRGDQFVVECLGQTYSTTQAFVWLNESKTLGIEFRVLLENDPQRNSSVRLIVHPDGLALVAGIDRTFERSIISDADMDSTAVAFLEAVAERALIGLARANY